MPLAASIPPQRHVSRILILTIISPDECVPILVFQLAIDILLHIPETSAMPLRTAECKRAEHLRLKDRPSLCGAGDISESLVACLCRFHGYVHVPIQTGKDTCTMQTVHQKPVMRLKLIHTSAVFS